MKRPLPPLGRRSMLLGGAASSIVATTGCSAYNMASDHEYGSCYDREYLVARGQDNCWPGIGTPTDLAWHLRGMLVPNAWEHSMRFGRASHGAGILIGHVDTGVAEHEALNGAILWDRGYDFVDNVSGGYDPLVNHIEYLEQIGHGTATASVIVSRGDVATLQFTPDRERSRPAKGDDRRIPQELKEIGPQRKPDDKEESFKNQTPGICNGTSGFGQISGVAPAAHLIPTRAFRLAATRNLDVVARAVDYLVRQDVHVITLALGWLFTSRALTDAIKRAIHANKIVLAAAGNFVPWVVFPANEGDAIAVAGLGPDDKPWCGGSTGKAVTISAYGDKVWRAYRDEKSNRLDVIGPRFGTSFAVSMTAGVAALWLAHHGPGRLIQDNRHKNLQEAFRAALIRTARKPSKWDEKYHGALGAGIVNALALVSEDDPTKRLS